MKQYPPFVRTDAGRKSSEITRNFHRDCSVRAYAAAFGVSYDVALERLRRAGRQIGYGIYTALWNSFLNTHPECVRLALKPGPGRRSVTLGQFLKQYPTGIYILGVTRHTFTVIDGTVHDLHPPTLRQPVRYAWRITRGQGYASQETVKIDGPAIDLAATGQSALPFLF